MAGESLENLPVRGLLRLSQTDITPDPETGYDYAVQAYGMARTLEVRATDPDARLEAASKAGFRAAQLDLPDEVDWWFRRAKSLAYQDEYLPTNRETIAMHLLAGRALGLLALKGIGSPQFKHQASVDFQAAEDKAKYLHRLGNRWDRYTTMSSRHYATHEAMNGKTVFAATTAMRGVWRAIRADHEEKPADEHKVFMKKHIKANLAAVGLAASRPFSMIVAV